MRVDFSKTKEGLEPAELLEHLLAIYDSEDIEIVKNPDCKNIVTISKTDSTAKSYKVSLNCRDRLCTSDMILADEKLNIVVEFLLSLD